MAVKKRIDLFSHNRDAYDAAVSMLAETGKAAVIHPTGTGKSFIGFRLAEDNPESVVCWLSPSEYIFKTQIENLIATGAEAPSNVVFFTYAKLMLMSEDELAEIEPDYIILDEFHRCGAEMWGKGVQNLLDLYPDTPILGLSATNIRYLDNRRDMADELFDGNVASEMTLGEAIVRGILKAPKYVVSVYSFQNDFNRIQSRIKRTRNKAARIKAEEYLEAMRRSVENADGLDVIFQKHITERAGKYLMFVPNAEVMSSVKEKCLKWFYGVDPSPHIYTAYSDDPETGSEFADFKNDKSDNLKILLTINMLNEGVHVDGISGVILFRPTVSPIIYKQQIGRALCADRQKEPLILDIVANVYNLYSVDSLKDEIADTVRVMTERGEKDKIITEDFTVYDEVKDCRRLFEELDKKLSSSWEEMFSCLKRFGAQFGHVNVPSNYKTTENVALGNWCGYQRRLRREKSGVLTEEHIGKLDSIGFVWEPANETWMSGYERAVRYKTETGNLDVPPAYRTEDGFPLGNWIRVNRSSFNSRALSLERIKLLADIGMIWDVGEYRWQNNYKLCKEYYLKYGTEVPADYTAPDGSTPGKWLARVKLRYINKCTQLRDYQIKQLKDIGVVFALKTDIKWNNSCRAAEKYYRIHGNLDVPSTYTTPDGVRLLCWLDYQRQTLAGLTHSTMKPERKARLDKMNFDWSLRETKPDKWMCCFESLRRYISEHNGEIPSQRYIDTTGLRVGGWLSNQIRKYRAGKLSEKYEEMLRGIGISFEDTNEKQWIKGYRHAVDYFNGKKQLSVPVLYKSEDGFPLGEWVRTQVKFNRAGKLTAERKSLLDKLDIDWKNKKEQAKKGVYENRFQTV